MLNIKWHQDWICSLAEYSIVSQIVMEVEVQLQPGHWSMGDASSSLTRAVAEVEVKSLAYWLLQYWYILNPFLTINSHQHQEICWFDQLTQLVTIVLCDILLENARKSSTNISSKIGQAACVVPAMPARDWLPDTAAGTGTAPVPLDLSQPLMKVPEMLGIMGTWQAQKIHHSSLYRHIIYRCQIYIQYCSIQCR